MHCARGLHLPRFKANPEREEGKSNLTADASSLRGRAQVALPDRHVLSGVLFMFRARMFHARQRCSFNALLNIGRSHRGKQTK
jgi:hypothetical protein